MAGDAPVRVATPLLYGLRPDSDIGGEVYERMLLERLPGLGVALRLGLPRDHALRPPLPSHVDIDLPGHRTGIHWTRAPLVLVPYLARLLRTRQVDVLRGHSVRGCGPSLLIARALTGSAAPVVIHHHHFYPRWHRLEAAILRAADAVVTVSEHSRRELLSAGVPAERIHVALDGVATPSPSRPDPASWPGGLRLLYVGRLEARKRPALAVDALAALRRGGGPEASLVIAGDGPQRGELEALARRAGIGDRVRFAGRVAEERKWQLYDSADVLLFGSTLEGFGLVVAEAQARGLPVVAAAGTATAEIIVDGQTGLLRPPDAEAFAAAVRRLADDAPLREAMGAEAARLARRFSWEACAAQVAGVLRGLAEEASRCRC